MKKILALLLASLLLIGLFAGCAKQETAPVQQEQTTTTAPAPAEQPAEPPSEQPEHAELPTARSCTDASELSGLCGYAQGSVHLCRDPR